MGSFKSFEKSKFGGRTPGKINASLNEKLKSVEWGEYKVEEIFTLKKIKRMLSKNELSSEHEYPAYSADSTNNGIVGYTNNPEFICDDETPVYITFGDHTRTMNIARKSFSVLDNVKVLVPIINNDNVLLFIIAIWQKMIPDLGYARHWKVAKKCILQLPTLNKEIDFAFMDAFIAELEAERVAELSAYLKVSGFDNYELSNEEEKALGDFTENKIEYKEYNIGELFEIKSYKKRFDANKVKIHQKGRFPYVVRMGTNNGQKGYIDEDERFLNDGNTISFGQDTATMFYQEKPYFTGDKIKILKPKNDGFNKINSQYFLTVMELSFSMFSWGGSKFDVKTIESQKILLPIKDRNIDFKFMETFISAIQKLAIKDVVLYADRKIKATKEVIKNK